MRFVGWTQCTFEVGYCERWARLSERQGLILRAIDGTSGYTGAAPVQRQDSGRPVL